jgi:hypothetical protein
LSATAEAETDQKAKFLKMYEDFKEKASNLQALRIERSKLGERIVTLAAEHAKDAGRKAVESGTVPQEPKELTQAKARLEAIGQLLPEGTAHLNKLAETLRGWAYVAFAPLETRLTDELNAKETELRAIYQKAADMTDSIEANERTTLRNFRWACRPLQEASDANGIVEGIERLLQFEGE